MGLMLLMIVCYSGQLQLAEPKTVLLHINQHRFSKVKKLLKNWKPQARVFRGCGSEVLFWFWLSLSLWLTNRKRTKNRKAKVKQLKAKQYNKISKNFSTRPPYF